MSVIETINFDHGVYAEIIHDEDCQDPRGDDGVKIVILHRRFINPSPDVGKDSDEVLAWMKENKREWFFANLYMYEHGSVALRAGMSNPFHDPWDSGQVGIIALKKSEWGRGKGERNAKRLEWTKNVAQEYGQWMNGECYGYILRNEDGEDLDSCWGFVGYEFVEEAAREAAEYHVKEEGERKAREAEDAAQAEADEMEAERPDMY